MPRKQKPLDRSLKPRPFHALFMIATEGEKTEKIYFECFNTATYRQQIKVKVLATKKGNSSPSSVLARLKRYAQDEDLQPQDQLWLVIDVPEWPPATLQQVYQACQAQGYHCAASYPSFELWLVLHQPNPPAPPTVAACITELSRLLGKPYQKNNYDADQLLRQVQSALNAARHLETRNHTDSPPNPWPQHPGTQVHRLVSELLNSAPHPPRSAL